MSGTNEAFSRVRIDAQLEDQGWEVLDTNSVRFEYVLQITPGQITYSATATVAPWR